MIEVIALACTVMAPLQCKNVKLSFAAESITPQQCMMYGQMELAKWIGDHPGWMISHGFKCGPAGRYANL
jgi:hypothetical protein